MRHKIIDNFLDEDHYNKLASFINSEDIPWYFRSKDTNDISKNPNGFFNFCFYNEGFPMSDRYQDLILPILKKLNSLATIQVRLNMVLRDIETKSSGWHCDYYSSKSKTAILYFTNCDAKTLLNYDNTEFSIESLSNRVVIFPSNIQHKVIYQTDVYKRFVLNLNYFEV